MRTFRIALSASIVLALGACSTTQDDLAMEDFWRDYCETDGFQADQRTGVTVSTWDPDATTAGHKGTTTNRDLEPDGSNPPPRGC